MNTKDKIVETAFGVFMLRGYNGTSMAELVSATGLSKGAFYHHFDSKENLYFSVIDSFFLRYFKEVDWSAAEGKSMRELEESIRGYFDTFLKEIKTITQDQLSRYYVLFFEAFEFHPTFKNEVQAFYTQLKSVIDTNCERHDQAPIGLKLITELEGFMFWNAVFPKG